MGMTVLRSCYPGVVYHIASRLSRIPNADSVLTSKRRTASCSAQPRNHWFEVILSAPVPTINVEGLASSTLNKHATDRPVVEKLRRLVYQTLLTHEERTLAELFT